MFTIHLPVEVADGAEVEKICSGVSPRQRAINLLGLTYDETLFLRRRKQYLAILSHAIKDGSIVWDAARLRVLLLIGDNEAQEILENLVAMGNFREAAHGRRKVWMLKERALSVRPLAWEKIPTDLVLKLLSREKEITEKEIEEAVSGHSPIPLWEP